RNNRALHSFSTRRSSDLPNEMPDRIAPTVVLLAAAVACAIHGCAKTREDEHAQQLASRVRDEFLHAWNNYERYAWGHDALRPLSKTAHDWYGQSLLM